MNMTAASRYFIPMFIVAVAMGLPGCGHDNPPERDANVRPPAGSVPSTPGTGNRPGVGDSDGWDDAVNDDVLRVDGIGGITMRYDRGGILVVTGSDGSVRFHDIDGADEVKLKLGAARSDSVVSDVLIQVNGSAYSPSEVKLMRKADGRIWYRVTDSAGKYGAIVIPAS